MKLCLSFLNTTSPRLRFPNLTFSVRGEIQTTFTSQATPSLMRCSTRSARTIIILNESRAGLYLWLKQRNAPPKKKAERKQINNAPNHPLHPSLETKLAILHRCFIEGENVQLVSEETGYSRASIYT